MHRRNWFAVRPLADLSILFNAAFGVFSTAFTNDESAIKSKYVNDVIISTDNKETAEIAEKAGESRKGAIKAQLPGLLKPEITAELLTNLVSDIGTSAQDTLLIQSAEWAKIFEDQKRST